MAETINNDITNILDAEGKDLKYRYSQVAIDSNFNLNTINTY